MFEYWKLGTWGAVFFPEHWLKFLKWLQTVKLTDSQAICTPGGLISNKWWLEGRQIWTPLFIRFAFDQGWYSLYTNFPKQEAFAVNFRESGLNFNETRGPMNSLVTRLEPSLHFNFTRNVPIFDFYFDKVQQEAVLAFRSSLWHHTHFTNQCHMESKVPSTRKNNLSITPRSVIGKQQVASVRLRTSSSNYSRSQASIANRLLISDCFKWSIFFEVVVIVATLFLTLLWACFANRQRDMRKTCPRNWWMRIWYLRTRLVYMILGLVSMCCSIPLLVCLDQSGIDQMSF